jgi:hypothetical protein
MFKVHLGRILTFCLVPALLSTSLMAAENHVVPLAELRQEAVSTKLKRDADLATVGKLLNLQPVQKALTKANLESKQVHQAASLLSDSELARLASRAAQLRADVEAGALSNLHLTYIVIALATAVIILVIVAA